MKYDGPPIVGDPPVNADEVITLCAPCSVFISGGATQGDGWVDAEENVFGRGWADPFIAALAE